jgi:hypothetical protein
MNEPLRFCERPRWNGFLYRAYPYNLERLFLKGKDVQGAHLSAVQSLIFFFFDATAPIWALAYLHETFRFTSVF